VTEVAITGIGLAHPHGVHLEDLARAFAEESPPARRIQEFDDDTIFPARVANSSDMDRPARLVTAAAFLALQDAGVALPLPCPVRTALVGGTAFAELGACARFHAALVANGPDGVNPSKFPNTSHNMACAQTAIKLGVEGPVFTVASGGAAGLEAILWGQRLLRSGQADLVLAGGYDAAFETLDAALESLGVLARRPYRKGVVTSEGACFLVLESAVGCRARGGRPLGTLTGHGQASGDGGLTRSLRTAVQVSGEPPRSAFVGLQGLRRTDDVIRTAYADLSSAGLGDPFQIPCKRVIGETFGAAGPFAVASAFARKADAPSPVVVDALGWGGGAAALVFQLAE